MKKLCLILPLALILCFMVSCQDKASISRGLIKPFAKEGSVGLFPIPQ